MYSGLSLVFALVAALGPTLMIDRASWSIELSDLAASASVTHLVVAVLFLYPTAEHVFSPDMLDYVGDLFNPRTSQASTAKGHEQAGGDRDSGITPAAKPAEAKKDERVAENPSLNSSATAHKGESTGTGSGRH